VAANREDPIIHRIQLGSELRRLREAAGKTTTEAAEHLGCGQPRVSKIEHGKLGIKVDEVRLLLDLYGASREDMEATLELVARRPTHARLSYRDAVPRWFRRFVALESAACDLRIYETECITGLLQVPEYAQAVIRAWEPNADDQEIERQVDVRLSRQSVLTRADPTPAQLEVIFHEYVLHRVIGGRETMFSQLRHLQKLATEPNVVLRVVPMDAAQQLVVASSFTLMKFPAEKRSVVYLEDVVGATYLQKITDVSRYSVVFGRLREMALSPEDSQELIARVAATYE
jgi:transcriptional regulator with XRE-family HTH domain